MISHIVTSALNRASNFISPSFLTPHLSRTLYGYGFGGQGTRDGIFLHSCLDNVQNTVPITFWTLHRQDCASAKKTLGDFTAYRHLEGGLTEI